MTSSPIPIVGGTGALGFGLALRLAKAGQEVVIGSRDAGRAAEAAAKVRERISNAHVAGMKNAEAAQAGEVVLLTVPFRAQSENLTNLKGVLRPGQILVDATVPLAAAVSGAEQAQEMVPDGVAVVSAFHTVDAATLADLSTPLAQDVLICGERKDDKRKVADIVRWIEGLRPVNAGALETARFVEALTPLLISVNIRNKSHAGVKLTGLSDEPW
jgi:NADPH-dependent F420 reductase